MKKGSFLLVLLGFVVLSIFAFPFLSNAQQFKPIRPQVLGKTYWCAEVEDILYNKEPVQGQRFTVGVRVKFTKKIVIPGAPRPKLCSCAFEGPTGAPAEDWRFKRMSLRLIGIKYSANETNLLEYGGPTPAFYPYDYSGFPVIGFVVTENDLKRGYIDVWNWTSKEPLQPRDFDIYVSLAIYPDGGPYDKEHECHFQGDFKKSFSPKLRPIGKTYWCAEVADILINPKDFSTANNISVGVRIRFKKQTYILGVPGQKLCNCAFEGPSGELARVWTKTISLRLIGLKYSEKETNVLEYSGPPPSFPIHTYSGFQVIGVTITEGDLKEGVKDVWGWTPKKNPLWDDREFKIYVTLDVKGYALQSDDDPLYLKEGCFPSGDFQKSFEPRRLEIPKIDLEKQKEVIEKGVKAIERPDLAIAETQRFLRIAKHENVRNQIFDEMELKIVIKNIGPKDASRFKVLFQRRWEGENNYGSFCDGRFTECKILVKEENIWYKGDTAEVNGLKAGESKTLFTWSDNSFVPYADCYIRIILDSDNEVAELDESNNGVSDIYFPNHYTHPEYYKGHSWSRYK